MNNYICYWYDIVEVLGINLRYSKPFIKLRKDLHKAIHFLNINRSYRKASRKSFHK